MSEQTFDIDLDVELAESTPAPAPPPATKARRVKKEEPAKKPEPEPEPEEVEVEVEVEKSDMPPKNVSRVTTQATSTSKVNAEQGKSLLLHAASVLMPGVRFTDVPNEMVERFIALISKEKGLPIKFQQLLKKAKSGIEEVLWTKKHGPCLPPSDYIIRKDQPPLDKQHTSITLLRFYYKFANYKEAWDAQSEATKEAWRAVMIYYRTRRAQLMAVAQAELQKASAAEAKAKAKKAKKPEPEPEPEPDSEEEEEEEDEEDEDTD